LSKLKAPEIFGVPGSNLYGNAQLLNDCVFTSLIAQPQEKIGL
jgi:hypothetical protein